MAQRTETDLTDLVKLLATKIEALDKRFVETEKKIETLDKKMDLGLQSLDKKIDLGFLEVKAELKAVETQQTLLTASVTKLDNRLWLFMGLVLAPTLTAVMGIVVRFVFLAMPNN